MSQQLHDERESVRRKTEDINEYSIKLEENNFEYQTLKEEHAELEKTWKTFAHLFCKSNESDFDNCIVSIIE